MNHKAKFKSIGKGGKIDGVYLETIYQAFKDRLADETNVRVCTCPSKAEQDKMKKPAGWFCPAHGTMSLL